MPLKVVPQAAPLNVDPDIAGVLGRQVNVDAVVNGEVLMSIITPTPAVPFPVNYTRLFVCTGTATFDFANSGNGDVEHAFVSFDCLTPCSPPRSRSRSSDRPWS
jgi:hypothetical protein